MNKCDEFEINEKLEKNNEITVSKISISHRGKAEIILMGNGKFAYVILDNYGYSDSGFTTYEDAIREAVEYYRSSVSDITKTVYDCGNKKWWNNYAMLIRIF